MSILPVILAPVALLIAHHAHIVQTVKVRQSLHVGLVFNQLLCASVQQPDVGVSLGHRLKHNPITLSKNLSSPLRQAGARASTHHEQRGAGDQS